MRAGSPCGCPCCCLRKSGAPLPLCGCFSCQLCAGSSREAPVRISPCVLVFRHALCPGPPRPGSSGPRQHRDQHAADCVALYVMEDDGPTACSQYECSAKGDRERTEIYVVPQTEFPQWLLSEKSMPEEGVELLRNRP